jgi:hypothetical protein
MVTRAISIHYSNRPFKEFLRAMGRSPDEKLNGILALIVARGAENQRKCNCLQPDWAWEDTISVEPTISKDSQVVYRIPID